MIIIASIIIFIGLICHGILSYWAMMAMQKESNRNSREIQLRHHQHEVEFAEDQAKRFRDAHAKK